ncbi:MAG: ATP-binding cassette domain-containing protein [Gemmatimonadales bacterium]|nr:MAG: ATP-binding cassette domain-containing protein [Gemmatimonadales bacterium]
MVKPGSGHLLVRLRARRGAFALDVGFETPGGITALFGPSGAGKSLTLRHLAGLERGSEGKVELAGRTLFDGDHGIDIPPRERGVGMVFQEYALFPHMSVAANIGYGLRELPRSEREPRVADLLERVGLAGYDGRRPESLSGGERQRVAVARALAPGPGLLLLDEPFGALDFRVRRGLRRELRTLHDATGVPMVLVTHSLAEVRELSDHLVLLDRGRVVGTGTTGALLADPPNAVAAELLDAEDLG